MDNLLAKALSKDKVELEISASKYANKCEYFYFYVDEKYFNKVKILSFSKTENHYLYTLKIFDNDFIPGVSYKLLTPYSDFIDIDISYLSLTPEFEKKYRSDEKLGALYTKKETEFRVFTPYATNVVLKLINKDEQLLYKMDRETSGCFSIKVKKDLEGYKYIYLATIFGVTTSIVDPYAKSITPNCTFGYVIDESKIKKIPSNRGKLKRFKDKTEAIIYECSIRDLTSLIDIENRGTFKGLLNEYKKNHPEFKLDTSTLSDSNLNMEASEKSKQSNLNWCIDATNNNNKNIDDNSFSSSKIDKNLPLFKDDKALKGIDYIKELGVTHVQFLPLLDFQTVNDDSFLSSYNWGYDPRNYFALKPGYSSNPSDPYCGMIELKSIISLFHLNNIRVNLDVVYNHVFSDLFFSYSRLVPNYFFRYKEDGSLSNGSFCGNEIESRNYMVRRMIIDSLSYLVDTFDVDGFRFDIMGLIDITTSNLAYQKLSAMKEDILLYGECWDMPSTLPYNEKTMALNSIDIPNVSCFNEKFRDAIRGSSNKTMLIDKGYLLGQVDKLDSFIYAMLGCSIPKGFAPYLSSHYQSLNYCECHDGVTLFDKIKIACPKDSEEVAFKKIKLCLVATLFAAGIPFFHEGEELGHSKKMDSNSYKSSDLINGFDYSLLNERKDLLSFFKSCVLLKKQFMKDANENYKDLPYHMSFETLENNAIKINYIFNKVSYFIIFNPTDFNIDYTFNTDCELCLSSIDFDYTSYLNSRNDNKSNPNLKIKFYKVKPLEVCIFKGATLNEN